MFGPVVVLAILDVLDSVDEAFARVNAPGPKPSLFVPSFLELGLRLP